MPPMILDDSMTVPENAKAALKQHNAAPPTIILPSLNLEAISVTPKQNPEQAPTTLRQSSPSLPGPHLLFPNALPNPNANDGVTSIATSPRHLPHVRDRSASPVGGHTTPVFANEEPNRYKHRRIRVTVPPSYRKMTATLAD